MKLLKGHQLHHMLTRNYHHIVGTFLILKIHLEWGVTAISINVAKSWTSKKWSSCSNELKSSLTLFFSHFQFSVLLQKEEKSRKHYCSLQFCPLTSLPPVVFQGSDKRNRLKGEGSIKSGGKVAVIGKRSLRPMQ